MGVSDHISDSRGRRLVLVGPPLEDSEVRSFSEKLEARGLKFDWLTAPRDASACAAWRTATGPKLEQAHRIVVIEPTAGRDPEGRYRRDLATLFAHLSPQTRARCIPCSWDESSAASPAGDVRPTLPGPRGRPIGDLAQDRTLDALARLVHQPPPQVSALPVVDDGLVVLSDHPAEGDGFGLQGSVDAFVSVIRAKSTLPPIVASVEGGWGVGKSSFLNLVRKELRRAGREHPPAGWESADPANLRTVWFNAWSSDSELATFSSFALALIEELENVHVLRRMLLRLRLAIRRFNWTSGWKDFGRLLGALFLLFASLVVALLGALKGSWLQDLWQKHAHVTGLLTAAGSATLGISALSRLRSFFGSPLQIDLTKHINAPDYAGKRSLKDQLYEDIAKILDVYTSRCERVYVFIDDLDRADPAKVAELTQTIGVILAKAGSKLVYILAIDREKVAAALAAKHKEIAGIVASVAAKGAQPLDFGQAFLEKLIQLPFRVPAPSPEDLRTWMHSLGQRTAGLGDVVRMVAPFLGGNPRRVKQFVNLLHLRLRLLYSAAGTSAKAPVRLSLHQLGKLTALEILYPFFIGDLLGSPSLVNALLIGTGPDAESNAYRRWSALGELLELLNATLPASSQSGGPLAAEELLALDRNTSLLDLDIAPLLRVGIRPTESPLLTPVAQSATELTAQALLDENPSPALALYRYAREYERLHAAEPPGDAGVIKLDRLFDDMTRVRGLTEAEMSRFFASGSPGRRLAALASCLSERHALTGELLRRILEAPASRFETYHALRVAKLHWNHLSEDDKQNLARQISDRFLNSVDEEDSPIWSLTIDLLRQTEHLPLAGDILVTFPEGISARMTLADYGSFQALIERLYFRLRGRVEAFQYGAQWRLVDEAMAPLRHRREIEGLTPGASAQDSRSPAELGMSAGKRYEVVLLRSKA